MKYVKCIVVLRNKKTTVVNICFFVTYEIRQILKYEFIQILVISHK